MPVVQRPVKQRKPSPLENVLRALQTAGYVAQAGTDIYRTIDSIAHRHEEEQRAINKERAFQLYQEVDRQRRATIGGMEGEAADLASEATALEQMGDYFAQIPGIGSPITTFNAYIGQMLNARSQALEVGSEALAGPLTIEEMRKIDPNKAEHMRQLVHEFTGIPIEEVYDNTNLTQYFLEGLIQADQATLFATRPDLAHAAAEFGLARQYGLPPGVSMSRAATTQMEDRFVARELATQLLSGNSESAYQNIMRHYWGNSFTTEIEIPPHVNPMTGNPVPPRRVMVNIGTHDQVMGSEYLMYLEAFQGNMEGAAEQYNHIAENLAERLIDELPAGSATPEDIMLMVHGQLPEGEQGQILGNYLNLLDQENRAALLMALAEHDPAKAQALTLIALGETVLHVDPSTPEGHAKTVQAARAIMETLNLPDLYPTWLVPETDQPWETKVPGLPSWLSRDVVLTVMSLRDEELTRRAHEENTAPPAPGDVVPRPSGGLVSPDAFWQGYVSQSWADYQIAPTQAVKDSIRADLYNLPNLDKDEVDAILDSPNPPYSTGVTGLQ